MEAGPEGVGAELPAQLLQRLLVERVWELELIHPGEHTLTHTHTQTLTRTDTRIRTRSHKHAHSHTHPHSSTLTRAHTVAGSRVEI